MASADGINDFGEVVGWFQTSPLPSGVVVGNGSANFIYAGGAYTVVDTVSGVFQAVNNAGQILSVRGKVPDPRT